MLLLAAAAVVAAATAGPAGSRPNIVFILSDGARRARPPACLACRRSSAAQLLLILPTPDGCRRPCSDLGYGDYAASDEVEPGLKPNSTRIPTPNIQRMAKNGMKFQRGYSGQVRAQQHAACLWGAARD